MSEPEPALPSLHEQRVLLITETYCAIVDALAARGRNVPPDVVARLSEIALRLILVRP
jgi:hypothetical protein